MLLLSLTSSATFTNHRQRIIGLSPQYPDVHSLYGIKNDMPIRGIGEKFTVKPVANNASISGAAPTMAWCEFLP